MRIIKYLVISIIGLIVFNSCRKIEQLPAVPFVRFEKFVVFDTTTLLGKYRAGRLEFYFEDGDGDLGLNPPTGNMSDTTNMFLNLYRKKGGAMVVSTDKNDAFLPYPSYRIPYMERLGVNKILKGTISLTFLYLSYSPSDTIKYDFFIRDRALNDSNVASTGEIVPSVSKTYTK
jgi:hypothetical protein